MGSSAFLICILSIFNLLQISFTIIELEPGLAVAPKISPLFDDELNISADWTMACLPVE